MPDLPSGTVTFLFTDIEGSTRLWEEYPQAMRLALARHDALLRSAIAQYDGYVFKTIGDAFCAAFPTAPDALNAALYAQLALQELNHRDTETQRNHPEAIENRKSKIENRADFSLSPFPFSLKVRMAMHTGAAEVRDHDYFGQPLNRVARLLSIGHGGQVLLSLPTQELVRDVLPPAVSLQALGEHRLRDLTRAEQVFQLLHPDLPAAFPPLNSLDQFPTNLPQQLTSFIGREREVAQIKNLLDKSRLLTLTGSGGCGKTRLALQVAAEVLERHPDGVWVVELASLADPALLPQEVASALGLTEQAGKTFVEILTDYLKSKRLLLVLDNCEHLLSACAQLVNTLLRACPPLTILATSREGLSIAGEQTYRVPSLSLPDPKEKLTVEQISQYEAVRLFIERAISSKSDFAATNSNAPALACVCHRLDGIPLAIELAAARVRSLSVEEINTRLDNRLRLLTGGSRTALPRQQTLRALIDWSYDLLTDQEKLLLCRLSVFAGGWTLEAAEFVCSTDEGVQVFRSSGIQEKQQLTVSEDEQPKAESHTAEPEYPNTRIPEHLNTDDVLDLLTSLVDKSLVIAETHGEATRYRLLETVRQYGWEHLVESGEDERLRGRHRDHFLALAEQARPYLRGSEQARWLKVLEAEHDNLRQALSFCEQDLEGGEAGLRLAGALGPFWGIGGQATEGRQRLTAALAHPGAQSDTVARATVLNAVGAKAWMQGDFAAARAYHEESLAIHRRLGDRSGAVAALINLGLVTRSQADHAAARTFLEEALATARDLGNRIYIADCLHGLGSVCLYQSEFASARSFYAESLAIQREIGNRWGMSVSLGNLGIIEQEQGNFESARALHGESLAIRRELGDRRGMAGSLYSFAVLAHSEQQHLRAARLWGAESCLLEAIGMPRSPTDQNGYDQQTARVRAALGEAAYAAAYEEGRAMTLEQAVEYALRNEEAKESIHLCNL